MNYITKSSKEESELLERFLRYVKIYSESSPASADKGVFPSTEQQKDFARVMKDELVALGLCDVKLTEHFYVYGMLHATPSKERVAPFCALAHLDTSSEVCGKNVNPLVHKNYDGSDISLACGVTHSAKNDKALLQAASESDTIITTDGNTLLGSDDKAGIAIIMTSLSYLVHHPEIAHGPIEVVFSPDEETGHGMDFIEKDLIHTGVLKSKRAYTFDGGHIGELETECFNAVGTTVSFTGKATHTGTARENKMVNAISMASSFVTSLPAREAPETTDGKEGFFAPIEIEGGIESARVYLL
ncbi:MAG: tripeptide aminopeptidase PepT, partial [Treponema sp.]|nr:tripeptide aminopeptidase PepT [Treponema sp.]